VIKMDIKKYRKIFGDMAAKDLLEFKKQRIRWIRMSRQQKENGFMDSSKLIDQTNKLEYDLFKQWWEHHRREDDPENSNHCFPCKRDCNFNL